jgi:hypothetical protein
MPEKMLEIKKPESEICKVRLDRLQIVADMRGNGLPGIPGFDVCRDSFVRPQTSITTYRRVRNYKNSKTRTTVDIQYQCVPPWLRAIKMTVIGDDLKGLQRLELEDICKAFKAPRVLTVEMAIDFSTASGVDRAFVLEHAILGRSGHVGGRFYKSLRYGTRHSQTMARAYEKPEISSYRIEIELHSSWLRTQGLKTLEDLSKLPLLLSPGRIQLVEIDWDLLAVHLSRKGLGTENIVGEAQSRAYSIHRALDFLRNEVGLQNVRRFLRPLRMNRTVRHALRTWAKSWRTGAQSNAGGEND